MKRRDPMRRAHRARIGAIPLIALSIAALACSDSPQPELRDTGHRAVIVGIDGADWKLIDALAARGELPNLTALRERGVSGSIATLPDIPLSPVIWTSVATGKTATKHGVGWFMVDRADGTRAPVRSYNRTAKAIWNLLAEGGRRPAVVGWWATYPAEDVGDGIIVSDGLGYHGFGATARDGDEAGKTHPPPLLARVAPLVPAASEIDVGFVRRFVHLDPDEYRAERWDPSRSPRPDPQNPIHLFQQYAATAQGYTAIAEELLEAATYDLFMVYFEQVDSFSHLFMKYAPPRLPWVDDAGVQRYRDAVAEWYRYQDELLGRVLANVDPETTAVFVVSDHGFKSGDRRIRSERTVDPRKAHLDHETHGVFIAAGPDIRRGAEVREASVLDVTPTVLHYLGFPVADDMDGKVLEEVFEAGFRQANPIRTIATYETGGPDPAPVVEVADEDALADRLRALEALGYVGKGADVPVTAPDGSGPRERESSPEIHNNLGRSHLARGETDEARREFQRALELDPRNAGALLNLGMLSRLDGRIADAERLVKQALQVDPNSVAALAQLAEINRDDRRLDESIRLYREALRIDDSQPFLFLGLGDGLQRAGRLDEAEAAFRSALELAPDSFEASYNLGVTEMARGRHAAAVPWFDKALALNPRHPLAAFALNNLGDIRLRRGEVERAIERFRAAIEAAPGHLESHYNLGTVYLGQGKIDQAIALLETASRIRPDHELTHTGLGMAYLQAGENERAYQTLLLVRRLYPENWVAPLGLALLHAGAGHPDKARPLLTDALRLGGDVARREAENYPILEGLR